MAHVVVKLTIMEQAVTCIGLDRVRGNLEGEVCLMAIGLQPIGNLVTRDRAGRFASLTRLHGLGRTIVGVCTEIEPIELETRPNVRSAPRTSRGATAVRAVVALTLMVVTVTATASRAKLGDVAVNSVAMVVQFSRWSVEYVRREFLDQWRLGLATVVPCAAFLAWLAVR